jgi:translation initiation factor 2B subunit (eIF-2B alpha/beta/delta family)
MEEISNSVTVARTAMATVHNIIKRIIDIMYSSEGHGLSSLRSSIIQQADREIEKSIKSVEKIGGHVAKLISPGEVIFTYSYSSTVLTALKEAHRRNGKLSVIVPRSGVWQVGLRMARLLAEAGISLTFIDDAASGIYISKCVKVLVGADRICMDGSLVNAAGTYLVAVLANRAGTPFYVLCETLKFDLRLKGCDVDLEEKEPGEVVRPGVLPPTVLVKNPYFDVTPLELTSGVVTENGLMDKKDIIACLSSSPGQARP